MCVLSCFSCVWLFATLWTVARPLCQWSSSGKNTGLGCHVLFQGIFPTQRSNPRVLHCQVGSLPLMPPGKPLYWIYLPLNSYHVQFVLPMISVSHFSSVLQLCPTLCNPMNRSMPGLPVHHQLPESTQTHVHWVSDAIQPSHPLSSPSPPATNPSQHQGLFQWVSSSYEVARVLEFQL